ncbi:MAG TPA: ATP-binding protein [Bacteroidia bacterium]|nr:ATP-binding protein [Bacteroidia bacterium]
MNHRPKILIVDDKPENLVALEVVLADLDVELIKATSGNEALKQTLHHDFALALLDIQMPEMDGYELAGILREEEKTSHMPFIFISAVYTDNLNVFKGYEKGAFSFITKPFQPEILINKVKFFIENHQHEAELKTLNENLLLANKELEQFAYVASHDLQEPLRTISNFVGLLKEKYSKNAGKDTNQYLDFIFEATTRMQNLIKDLLSLSRIGRNDSFKMVDSSKIVESVLSDLTVSINESKAKITYSNLPVLPGNETELKQLFQNLLSNAIKFSKKNVPPVIEIKAEEKEHEFLFSVKDNGIGFEEQFKERVFVIFQRLNHVYDYEGTGIGLATCKKIVSIHNGRIWVDSKPNEGSTFYFTLPKGSKHLLN